MTTTATAHQRSNRVLTTTVIDLLDALRAHLTSCDLPAPWAMNLTTYSDGPNVSIQLACCESHEVACALLAWADTLTRVTAEAWRSPRGDSVHLSVTGHLPDGVSLRIYSGVPFTEHGLGADLAPDATTTIPLATLRHLATDGALTA
ncbi:MAG: hypothetical protein ACRDRU_22965 [Pseudonocardiaceae bacterium]